MGSDVASGQAEPGTKACLRATRIAALLDHCISMDPRAEQERSDVAETPSIHAAIFERCCVERLRRAGSQTIDQAPFPNINQFPGRGRGSGMPISGVAAKALTEAGSAAAPLADARAGDGAFVRTGAAATGTPSP